MPGLVISPYAKTGYIDHQQLSHDAYLKFIEDDFLDGERLNPATDGRPDTRPDVREEAPASATSRTTSTSTSAAPAAAAVDASAAGPALRTARGPAAAHRRRRGRTSLAQTAATLNATVNPNGGTLSDCHFEYGTSTSYETSLPCVPMPTGSEGSAAVSASLEGLSPDTSYHFRVVATNGYGTTDGSDQMFTTLPYPPTVTSARAGRRAQSRRGAGGDPRHEPRQRQLGAVRRQ